VGEVFQIGRQLPLDFSKDGAPGRRASSSTIWRWVRDPSSRGTRWRPISSSVMTRKQALATVCEWIAW
jgi:hypothetical protein